ncbi:hypothetical protein BV898_16960 [Hypsibius exemplaris]|uniref:Uncharacterized protein n=1 Tax=Hypsibius exemplaris TaxID=2072580 RepID=A0A9X6NGV4_HYPEX|nr:hypothetical protein BV898_16960 [Hypsibius exemplaris]
MFQKSVKKRAKEEALQQKRTRNADNFFETIHELTRNLREASSLEVLEEGEDVPGGTAVVPVVNGDVTEPQALPPKDDDNINSKPNGPLPPSNLSLDPDKKTFSAKLNRQDRIGSAENVSNFSMSNPDFQRPIAGILHKGSSASLKEAVVPKKRVWLAQNLSGTPETWRVLEQGYLKKARR